MSVSHCMGQALRIARKPRSGWKAAIECLPDSCEHADCGAPHSCRQRIADYLRMQWRMAERRPRR